MPVAAGDNHNKIVGGDVQLIDRILKAVADNLPRQGEAPLIGEIHAVIHHGYRKIAPGGKLAQGLGNMPATQDDQALPGGEGIDKAIGVFLVIKAVFRPQGAVWLLLAAAHGAGKGGQIALLPLKAGFNTDGASIMDLQQCEIIGITNRHGKIASLFFR